MQEHFVDLLQHPQMILSPRYATKYNFVGTPLTGYNRETVIVSQPMLTALLKVSQSLNVQGYDLVVYDSYRPQSAVDHYCVWARDEQDTKTKQLYYPNILKKQLIPQDYIAEHCPHSRGCAVDVTIIKKGKQLIPNQQITIKQINLNNNQRSLLYMDDGTQFMGTHFDCFDVASHHDNELIGAIAKGNRDILRQVMKQNGFIQYQKEWWHYQLEKQPYPDTYLDFYIN